MALVKQLRDASGAPMMECKDAISAAMATAQSDADILSAATDILRKKGISTANKKSGRAASEGLAAVTVSADRTEAAVVEINSETDFCARNERFQALVSHLSASATQLTSKSSSQAIMGSLRDTTGGSDIDLTSMLAAKVDNGTVQSLITDTITSLRENIQLRRVGALSVKTPNGVIGRYVHNAVASDPAAATKLGRTATLVALEFVPQNTAMPASSSELIEIANKLAMHITAANPQYLSISSVPASVIEHERQVLLEQGKAAGKDEKHLDKVVQGRLNKFYEEACLLEQKLVVTFGDPDAKPVKVQTFLNETGKKMQGQMSISGFIKFAVGETVVKQEKQSFADEVASKLKSS